MCRLTFLEWCLVAVGALFVGTGLWMVISPRPMVVLYQYFGSDSGTPGTHWYSLTAPGARRAGIGVMVVGAASLWLAVAGTRRRRDD